MRKRGPGLWGGGTGWARASWRSWLAWAVWYFSLKRCPFLGCRLLSFRWSVRVSCVAGGLVRNRFLERNTFRSCSKSCYYEQLVVTRSKLLELLREATARDTNLLPSPPSHHVRDDDAPPPRGRARPPGGAAARPSATRVEWQRALQHGKARRYVEDKAGVAGQRRPSG